MKKLSALLFVMMASMYAFAQVDTTFIYNPSTPYGTLDLRIAKSSTRYYYLQEGVTFSFRESSPGVKTNTYRPMTSWNTADYQQGNLREKNGGVDQFVMNYRLLFPKNYNPGYDPGYPIIIQFHGAGETGNCWMAKCYWEDPDYNPVTNNPPAPTDSNHELLNNDRNLFHGALQHLDAVKKADGKLPNDPTLDPRAFPGFVLYPQSLNGWQQPTKVEDAIRILRLIIKKYNIDENRVYIHGLSNGGWGVNQALKRAPWMFAAALTMSAVSDAEIPLHNRLEEVAKLPLWIFQGGQDTNPTPSRTFRWVKRLRDVGAVVRYYNYPSLGHGTWNTAYKEPDFFTWILSKKKFNPHVTYGTPVICNTTGTGVKMSFSEGFLSYQWQFNGQTISGATQSTYVATQVGTYRGRFSRKANPSEADWEPWSDPINVTEIEPAKPSVLMSNTTHLRGPGQAGSDATNSIRFTAGVDAELYEWYKNGQLINFVDTDIDDTLSTVKFTSSGTTGNGIYTLVIKNSYCPSPASDPLNVYFNNSAPLNITLTAADVNFKGSATSSSSIFLTWNDKLTNELGYEVWRRKPGEQFVFVTRTLKDAISYTDQKLEPSITYEYKLRAVNNSGRSNYVPSDALTTNLLVKTLADTQQPTAPGNVVMTSNTIHSITLTWSAGNDETGIKEYVIYYGDQQIVVPANATTYTIENLPPNTVYPITIRTRDYAGHLSQPSNEVVGSTYVSGLYYKHSTGVWSTLDDPTCIATFVTPEFTGHVPNFTLTPRTQEDFYNFQFKGYINLAEAGPYQFRITSDDGSKLLLDDSVIVNNDGKHGNRTLTSDTLHLASGLHTIEVQYFDNTGNQNLVVQYKGPGIGTGTNFINIPDAALKSGTPPGTTSLTPPVNLTASLNGESVNLAWEYSTDTDSIDFEISRAELNGQYSVVGRSEGVSFIDSVGLKPSKTYQYKIRAVKYISQSDYSNVSQVTMATDEVPPSAPTNLTIQTKTSDAAAITWTASSDNSGSVTYEVFVNGQLIGSTGTTSYTIENLSGNIYSVTVVAIDVNNNRSESSAALTLDNTTPGTYYSLASGEITDLSTWKNRQDGTGSSPANFTEGGQTFILTNRTQASLNTAWTISGSNSKVILGEGVAFTLKSDCSCQIELRENSKLIVNTGTVPTLLAISPTSSIEFNGTSIIPDYTYGNVVLNGTGSKTFAAARTNILGDLQVADNLALTGNNNAIPEIKLHGSLSFNDAEGTPVTFHNISLIVSENTLHTIQSPNAIGFFKLEAETNARINVQTGGNLDITLGSEAGGGAVLKTGALLELGKNNLVLHGVINGAGETGKIALNSDKLVLASKSGGTSNLYLDETNNTVALLEAISGTTNFYGLLNISEEIKINGGTVNAGDGSVRLLALADKSASVARIQGGSINGSVRVQQLFSPVGDAWREISVPVSGATVASLQTTLPVTGNFTGASNAFGTSPSLFRSNGTVTSMDVYPPSGGSNTSALERGKGYLAYLHRQNDTTELTIEVKGMLAQGPTTLPVVAGNGTANSGWALVANPYASSIKLDNGAGWTRSGISNIIITHETKLENDRSTTRYIYHDLTRKSVALRAGQAFWVQGTDSNPSVTLTEDVKTTETSSGSESGSAWHIIAELRQGELSDEAHLYFSPEGTDAFNPNRDAAKRKNRGMFSISTFMSDTISLAVNHTNHDLCQKNIGINIQNAAPGSYSLALHHFETMDGVQWKLIDRYTSQTLVVTSTPYEFSINSDPASYGKSRIELELTRASEDIRIPNTEISTACFEENAQIVVTDPQSSVTYAVYSGSGSVIAEGASSTALTIEVPYTALTPGTNSFILKAEMRGCGKSKETPISITYSQQTIAKPVVTVSGDTLWSNVVAESYQWTKDGEVIPGATSEYIVPKASGQYRCIASNGTCSKVSDPMDFVYSITSTDPDLTKTMQVDIYPNPSQGKPVTVKAISHRHEPIVVELINMMGQRKYVQEFEVSTLSQGVEVAPTTDMQSGFYLVILRQGEIEVKRKIAVQK